MDTNNIDFLAIGDIVNDDFIDLQDATITEGDHGSKNLSMRFGDKIPYKDRELIYAVGNSPNAAVSATRLGLSAAIMTHVGNDELGEKTIEALKERGVNTEFVTKEEGQKTNYHFVLRYNAERTILIKHAEFNYNLKQQTEGKPTPTWAYFSSVAENSLPYHHEIAAWVQQNNIKLAFQPGTFQIKLGYETLKDIYESTAIFFCNVEEAIRILTPVIGEAPIEEQRNSLDRKGLASFLMKEMKKLGPDMVCITDGPDGAYAHNDSGTWFMPVYPDPAPPIDRTGAGDSFSSTFTSAIALGHDIPTALSWGPINSMSVVQYVGAQAGLLPKEKLLEHLANAPEGYTPQQLH